MMLSELMANHTVNPTFTGFVTNDDWVLAVDVGAIPAADFTSVGEFAVVQLGVAGLDSNLNPVTQDKVYLRAGTSTTKTGNQRSFSITGDCYVGDEFQDFALSHEIKYGTGQAVVRKYVYFNIITGKGEQGEAVIIINSDGSGEAGNSSEIDIELKKSGSQPTEYTWSA
jgi:hypothetical protein